MENKSQNLDFNIQINQGQNAGKQSSVAAKEGPEVNVEVKTQDKANNEEITASNFLYHANHPVVCFFTLIFKFISIFSFIILSFFNKNAYIYLIIIMFSAFDFWVVKNVSGRILVGLRWWNEVKTNGEEVWVYETKVEGVDKKVFWYSLYGNMGIWGLLLVWQIIKIEFTWIVVAGICAVFAQINLYAYLNCSKEQQGTIASLAVSTVVKVVEKGAAASSS